MPKQRANHWITGRKIPNLRDGLQLRGFPEKAAQGEVSRRTVIISSQRVIEPSLVARTN